MKELKIISPKHGEKIVTLDDEDYNLVCKLKWHVRPLKGKFYCATTLYPHKRTIGIHRFILGDPKGVVDHKDGNSLNNCRSNLRICSQGNNVKNRSIQHNNKTGYKGVYFRPSLNKFITNISVNNKTVYLGVFDSPESAASAYNDAAKKHYGEFAKLNSIPCVGSLVA